MIGTLHAKAGTWMVRKDRKYCPKCGRRLSADSCTNGHPNCQSVACRDSSN